MRIKHSAKVRLAKQLQTLKEATDTHKSLFESEGWLHRKWSIARRVHRQEVTAHYYSEVRKGQRGQKVKI